MNTKNIFAVLAAALIFIGGAVPPLTQAEAAVTDWQRGASIRPESDTDFGSEAFRQSVDQLAATGVNFISLIIPYYQSNLWSTDIQRGWNTPTDQALTSATQYVKSKGLAVEYKPHMESYTGEWRAGINPGDRETWFANYGNMLRHYAVMAEDLGIRRIVVGSELISMSAYDSHPDNTRHWNNLISETRGLFSGELTYSANWGTPGFFADEKNRIEFWPVLDYIGIAAYYNLNADNNSVEALKGSWNHWEQSDIAPLQNRVNKPVMFTEIGYISATGAHREPWNYGYRNSFDEQEQANAYQALFEYWGNIPYMAGVNFWEWRSNPDAGGQGNIDYTPQNKRAQDIMFEYFNGGGGTTPPPSVSCAEPGQNAFTGCYYRGTNLSDSVLSRTDNSINFDWGASSPDPAVPSDHFSARWAGRFDFGGGDYEFTATADDGVRVYVNNQLLINQWNDQPATTYTAALSLSPGTHTVTMEYYENAGGAVARLSWDKTGQGTTAGPPTACGAPANGAFTGCYYNGRNFNNLAFTRTDTALNFDWEHGSPAPNVQADSFSVRWEGSFHFEAGEYEFISTTDDGMRVFINNQPVIDEFFDQPPTTHRAKTTLSQGTYTVKVEYYEHGGSAVAKLSWQKVNGSTPSPTPSSGGSTIDIWWPTDGSSVSGTTPFKAIVPGLTVEQYVMYWQVDGGGLVQMHNSFEDYPHKHFLADLSGWNWRGEGPYLINFLARDSTGNTIAQRAINIFVR